MKELPQWNKKNGNPTQEYDELFKLLLLGMILFILPPFDKKKGDAQTGKSQLLLRFTVPSTQLFASL